MHTNSLVQEKSPYLRQHAHNPVAWLPWGDVALERARGENKPIFLSIGYSTCHWCHVMAHESFEDEAIAAVLNSSFVPIKLDREERPDIDRIYMLFVQATTGSGGWPMSVFLTPDLKPFFGGTYFPPDSRYGRPGFKDILEHIARLWSAEQDRIVASSANILGQLSSLQSNRTSASWPDRHLFENAFQLIRRSFDSRWGGFGGAPKFPRPVVYNYLLRLDNQEAHEMVFTTLRNMARGGMHDQLGGGFHRYSVDERWFVPHFEKMLYDQAQLATSYLEAYQAIADPAFAATARDIFAYVFRDMRDPSGAFYSAEDADSPDPEEPGHSGEGAFYIWSWQEIERLLGTQLAPVFARHYGVERNGNVESDPQGEFVQRNILYVAEDGFDERLDEARSILFEARSKRPRPHLDNKILTSWNALMISAFARGYAVLREPAYKDAAVAALEFILAHMYNPEAGRLYRRYAGNEAAIDAFLDDYAFLAQALLDVFDITFDLGYLERAIDLATRGFPLFEDAENGGFFSTTAQAPDVLLRLKDDYDGAEPSGNSVAVDVLIRLGQLTGDKAFEPLVQKPLAQASSATPQMLVALGRSLTPPSHTIIRARQRTAQAEGLLHQEWNNFAPYANVLLIDDESAPQWSRYPAFRDNLERRGEITIYRCRNFTCSQPETIQ